LPRFLQAVDVPQPPPLKSGWSLVVKGKQSPSIAAASKPSGGKQAADSKAGKPDRSMSDAATEVSQATSASSQASPGKQSKQSSSEASSSSSTAASKDSVSTQPEQQAEPDKAKTQPAASKEADKPAAEAAADAPKAAAATSSEVGIVRLQWWWLHWPRNAALCLICATIYVLAC
jgi:cell pole-organizing protein PopZ